MRTRRIATTVLLYSLLSCANILAAAPDARSPACRHDRTSAACRFSQGLLWKIERAGVAPSFLFGTIHIADPRVTRLSKAVDRAFAESKSFTMEIVFDGAGVLHMADVMFFNDDRTLEGAIGAERYAELKRTLERQKKPVQDLNKKKPWVAAMMLSERSAGGVPLDFQLQLRATLEDKPTHGLETVQEQMQVFDGLPIPDQVALLDHALRTHAEGTRLVERMTKAYMARDLAQLMGIVSDAAAESAVQQTVMRRLLTDRNLTMAQRMQPRLEEGGAFIAVGAAHLPGEQGLLALLERGGWRVTRAD